MRHEDSDMKGQSRHSLTRWMQLELSELDEIRMELRRDLFASLIFLLMQQWRTGKLLPNDDKILARIAGMDLRTWRRNRATLLQRFSNGPAGLQHPCTTSALQHCIEVSEKRRAAANSRWNRAPANASNNRCKSNTKEKKGNESFLSVIDREGVRDNPPPQTAAKKVRRIKPGRKDK